MRVIGIETSGNVGSVAVCEDDTVIGERCFERGMRHGRELITSIKAIFEELYWKPDDIKLIAVSAGPGSYTGLRVGITCAKTLAYALNKPVIAVPTLDVIAENAPVSSHSVCPILDAKRMCVYACVYKCINGTKERVSDFLIISPRELLALLPRPVTIFGDGTKPYFDIFNQEGILISKEEMGIARAQVVARLGRKLYEGGKRCNLATLTPLYLRKPEPVEKLESQIINLGKK
ncbi:MAG TPA: tRNA (adenosine(37)-N6)-threonylcarbamoyltransferase complex dimerization subunit type 1 TsaB [Candidatus Brocadiia bacterium]|nr:tRNA (adenosine(37)-N6)-threonylcarbamoyltransferase complex dimerization subunit type 1 TsaB [Planctomycetota bacterium]MDO8094893.1 tRNA (adenosine(37)-N6)-threonylcarbamoyltransferase complex dimerization subunit type 1 TsaB [Candidatus Brocadiales bacterium]